MKTKRFKINPSASKDGWKTNDHWLAEALGVQYSRRRGYTLASANRVAQWEALRAAGFEASRRLLGNDRTPYHFTHENRPGERFTLAQAVKLCPDVSPTSPTEFDRLLSGTGCKCGKCGS